MLGVMSMAPTWDEMTPEQIELRLGEMDAAQEVLDGFAQVMREWQATSTLSPHDWGTHVWNNCPTFDDALFAMHHSRYLDELLPKPVR